MTETCAYSLRVIDCLPNKHDIYHSSNTGQPEYLLVLHINSKHKAKRCCNRGLQKEKNKEKKKINDER